MAPFAGQGQSPCLPYAATSRSSEVAALIMSGEMAVAFWMAHVGRSGTIFPLQNGGESAVLFCFVFLYIVFAGPGAWSIDGRNRSA